MQLGNLELTIEKANRLGDGGKQRIEDFIAAKRDREEHQVKPNVASNPRLETYMSTEMKRRQMMGSPSRTQEQELK